MSTIAELLEQIEGEDKTKEASEDLVDEVYKEAKKKLASEFKGTHKAELSPLEMYENVIQEKTASLGGAKGELFEKIAKLTLEDFTEKEDMNFSTFKGGQKASGILGVSPKKILNKKEELQ